MYNNYFKYQQFIYHSQFSLNLVIVHNTDKQLSLIYM